MKRIAIMQPTYLPWVGYFGLISAVDCFVILDSVQFARRSWQQRNQIKTNNGSMWLTLPVISKGHYKQKINNVRLDSSKDYLSEHTKSIHHSYAKAKFYPSECDKIFNLIDFSNSKYLVDITVPIIKNCCKILGIKTQILSSSELNLDGVKDELLVSICKFLNADEYISPPGSKVYLEDSKRFVEAKIDVSYFNFTHPVYPQINGDFLPYMSIIDLIFNCGPNSMKFINDGIESI
jgi:hypothetical protein